MSTLWTPDGEREVPRSTGDDAGTTDSSPTSAADQQTSEGFGVSQGEPDLTPEQREQAAAMAKELAEARARILATEASTVVANHAFGIYELAAIHLTADEPKLSEAKVAIDALAALITGLEGRLGENESVLTDALRQAQMLFVQQSDAASGGSSTEAGSDA